MPESAPAFLEIEQSLPICCALAAAGGMLEVAATACTAVPSVRAAQSSAKPWWWKYLALAGNVTLQLIGSTMSHLVATWFGPVSMVVPFFYSSTLLCNMLIFGALLGLEFFTKTAKTGTLVIVVAVILLPVVGPSVQEGQEIRRLMQHWYASLWFCLLLTVMSITGILIFAVDIAQRFSQRGIALILLSVRASSIAINLTVSKGFVSDLDPTEWLFTFFLVLKIVSGGIYTYAIVVQSTAIKKQAQFLPLNTTAIITVNALTGIFIWEDYKVMASWYGYACVFCLLGLGCELLLDTEVPLLTEDNADFGIHKRASMVMITSPLDRRRSTLKGGLEASYGYKEIDQLITENEEKTYVESVNVPRVVTTREPHALSRRDAWKFIIGIPQGTSNGLHATYGAISSTASSVSSAATSATKATALATKAVTSTWGKVIKGAGHAISAASKAIGNSGVKAAEGATSSATKAVTTTSKATQAATAVTKVVTRTGDAVVSGTTTAAATTHATPDTLATGGETDSKLAATGATSETIAEHPMAAQAAKAKFNNPIGKSLKGIGSLISGKRKDKK